MTMITNAGGPGVLATDALLTSGGALAEVSAGTIAELNKILPAAWTHNNPIDVLGDASAETLRQDARDLRTRSRTATACS